MKQWAATISITVAAVLTLPVLLAGMTRQDQIAGLSQDIRYDDFSFSVSGVTASKTVGSGSFMATAQGIYYIVTLKVANYAKRVDFRFKHQSPILIDNAGREFHPSNDGRRALELTRGSSDPCSTPIVAGAFCITQIVFDVPVNITDPHLRISTGGSIGDILDTIFYGKKLIKLGPPQ